MHAEPGFATPRRAGPWLIAIVIGGVGVALSRSSASIVDPPSCPGALELAAVAAARLLPTTPLATILSWSNALAAFVMLVAVVRLVQSTRVPLAGGLAVGLGAAFALVPQPALTPTAAWAVAVAASTLVAARALATDLTAPRRAGLLTVAGLVAASAIASTLAAPFAVLAAWCIWSAWKPAARPTRGMLALAAAASALLAVVAVRAALPVLPGAPAGHNCGVSSVVALSPQTALDNLSLALSTTGPVPLVLALLGAFTLRAAAWGPRAWFPIAIAVLPLFTPVPSGSDHLRTLATTVVAQWWLAAIGLKEAVLALGNTVPRRAGAAALFLAVALLQWSHRSPSRILQVDTPVGHEDLTRRAVARLLGVLPDRASLVVDDAITDLLLRASMDSLARSGKTLQFVAADGEAVTGLAARGRVFALPRAQQVLQHQGLILDDHDLPQAPGVAGIQPGVACARAEASWRPIADPQRWTTLALVSDRAAVRGPILVYLGSAAPLAPHPLQWPDRATRGFLADVYYARGDRRRLDWLIGADRAPGGDPVFTSPYVTRLELWRVPDAPLILPVSLGGAVSSAIVIVRAGPDAGQLRACPSFPRAVSRVGQRP